MLSPITQSWLGAVLSSNVTPAILYISVNPAGLAVGSYMANIEVSSGNASNDLFWGVTLTVSPPTASLMFNVVEDGPAPPTQTVSLGTSTTIDGFSDTIFLDGTLPGWLAVCSGNNFPCFIPFSVGTAPVTLTIGVNPSGLSPGTYHYSLTFNDIVSNTWTVQVTLVVTTPALAVNTNQLQFQCSAGLSNPASQVVQVKGSGECRLDASITVSVPWLVTSVQNGVTPFNLNIQPDCAALAVGNYTGMVVVKDTSFTDSQTVNISLTVGRPILSITAVTNAALPSLDVPPSTISLAPRSMATIFGTNLADIIASSTSPWTSPLGGTEVHLASDTCFESSCDLVAKLIYVSSAQVNFLVPDITVVGPTHYRIVFVRDGQRIDDQSYMLGGPGRVIIDPSGSADYNVVFQVGYDCLFSYSVSDPASCGLSWVNGEDRALTGAVTDAISGQLISSQNPSYQGRLITLWMTALYGGVTLNSQSGLRTGNMIAPITFGVAQAGSDLTTAFVSPTPLWAGESPQFVGLDQVNVAFPNCINPPATTEKRYDAFLSYTSLETSATVRIYLPFVIRPGDPDCQWGDRD
jgi:hypothetical protein